MKTTRSTLPGRTVGSLIAAVFGTVYVSVNSRSLPAGVAWTLTVVSAAACVGVLVSLFGPASRAAAVQRVTAGSVFGRSFWAVVAVEVVALFGGNRVLAGPLGTPQAGVAWTSIVVGVHFVALAVVVHQPFFHVLGGVITACGVASLILAFSGSGQPAIDLVGGVLPGLTLLGFAGWGARRQGVRSLSGAAV
ncbi:MAG: hypothetical protein ABIR83_08380 [Nakamurella sp.]